MLPVRIAKFCADTPFIALKSGKRILTRWPLPKPGRRYLFGAWYLLAISLALLIAEFICSRDTNSSEQTLENPPLPITTISTVAICSAVPSSMQTISPVLTE